MLNFDWIAHLPQDWARIFVVGLFVVALIFALSMNKSYIFSGVEKPVWYMNLKLWVLVLVGLQVSLYFYF